MVKLLIKRWNNLIIYKINKLIMYFNHNTVISTLFKIFEIKYIKLPLPFESILTVIDISVKCAFITVVLAPRTLVNAEEAAVRCGEAL